MNLKIIYYLLDDDECDIDFYVDDDEYCNCIYHGSNGEFVCEFLNNDYTFFYDSLLRSLIKNVGEKEAYKFLEYRGITEEIDDLKLCASSVDREMYKSFVNEVLLNKDKVLNTKQRLDAYALATGKYDLINFNCETSVNIEIDVEADTEDIYGLIEGLPEKEAIQRAKELIKGRGTICCSYMNYKFTDFKDMLNFVIYTMIRKNETIKLCSNCGRYFYPENRSDTIYCAISSPQDSLKSCQEYGAVKTYQDNLKNNECMGLYRKIYMRKQMLSKRNSEIESYKIDFENYKTQSKQWKNDVKNGVRTEAEYLSWLKSISRKDDD